MSLVPPQRFRKTDGIHRTGLASARPLASNVLVGTLYFSTDTLVLERSNGTSWDPYSGSGGSSAIILEGEFAGRGSTSGDGPPESVAAGEYLAIFGNTADVAGAGLTPFIVQSLTVARADAAARGKDPANYLPRAQETALLPSGYVTVTTGTGVLGSNPQIPIGDTTGSIPDNRLSSNVALINAQNVFRLAQIITNLDGDFPRLTLFDKTQPVSEKSWQITNFSKSLNFWALDEPQTGILGVVSLTRDGSVNAGGKIFTEGRTTAEGYWIDIPFNAANFTANGGGTWTVGAPAVIVNRYTLIGKTMVWSFFISWFSGSNIVAGTATTLALIIPGGFQAKGNDFLRLAIGNDGGATEMYASTAGNTVVITKLSGAGFTAGNPVGVVGVMTLGIL